MQVRSLVLATLLAALLAVPAIAAAMPTEAPVPDLGAPAGDQERCVARANPPCGWIDPILDLRFPDKLTCEAGLGQQPDPATCHSLDDGETLVLEGSMVWWWDVSQDGTYPLDPAQDIEITFTPTERDPDWLPFTVDPPSFTITNADLLDQANYRQEEQEGSVLPRTVFWYERPVTLTLTRDGDPEEADATFADARGFTSVFVKAKSTPSGDRFRASFGIEEVRLTDAGPVNDAPAPLWPFLALLPLALRRRAVRPGP